MKLKLLFTTLLGLLSLLSYSQLNFEQIQIDNNTDTYPHNFTEFNGEMYFTATSSTNGEELWKYNGTTASLVKDINPSGNGSPRRLTVANNLLFFTADDGANGRELWKSDGTSAGTVMVKDILTGVGNGMSATREPFVFGNSLYITADYFINGFSNGVQLWKATDATLSTPEHSLGIAVSLYPNPTANVLNINTNDTVKRVELYSMSGCIPLSRNRVYRIHDQRESKALKMNLM